MSIEQTSTNEAPNVGAAVGNCGLAIRGLWVRSRRAHRIDLYVLPVGLSLHAALTAGDDVPAAVPESQARLDPPV